MTMVNGAVINGFKEQGKQFAKALSVDTNGMLAGSDVFGTMTNGTFDRLQKALVASPSTPGGPGDGSSLIPQSLARTLKNQTFKMRNVKAWRNIAKQEAFAMDEQFDRLDSYGTRGGIFTSAMQTPAGNDSTFERVSVPMKYMATAYATDIAIMATEVVGGSAEALQINNATRFLIGGVNRAIYYGDSSLMASEFDGWKKILQDFAANTDFTNVVIDAEAGPLTPDILENAAEVVQDNAGDISSGMYKAYMAPRVQSYWSKTYAPMQRTQVDQTAYMREGVLNVGTPVGGYNSTYGNVPFENDIFLNLDQPVTVTIQNAPAIPTAPTATLNTAQTGSKWEDASSSTQYGVGYNGGPVQYAIEAVNAYGPSELSPASASVTVGAGDTVTVTWNRVTGTNGASYYQIYRNMNGAGWLPLTRVPDAGSGTTQTFTDDNSIVAGTYDVFLINHDPEEGAVFKQLLPFFKWPLPIAALARYFAVALIGAPQIYVPSRCVLIRNIQIPGNALPTVQLT